MDEGPAAASIRRSVQGQGWACGFARVERLADLQAEAAALGSRGADPQVIRERLAFFEFHPPASLPSAASIIAVAVPLPAVRLWFTRGGRRVPVMVPPAYIGFDEAGRRVQAFLDGMLSPCGRRTGPALLPEKLLAARIGLAHYGRNNLAYVPRMGSLHRLATFYTDLPLEEDAWGEPRELPRCAHCSACARQCPTGAIPRDRFLLRADRCLVFHNERPARMPFPQWIPASAHQCLVGCRACQEACPENSARIGWTEEGGEFTEAETSILLEAPPLESLEPLLREKLERADLAVLYGVLSRNLEAALLAAPAAAPP